MKILAIDSSATAASAALAEDGRIIAEYFIDAKITHSQTLLPMTESILKASNMSMSDIDAVAVNAGPGSFTGVRIGVAAAKGLAFKDDKPCVAVSTLMSMAYNVSDCDCVICAVMDARCSQVYNALFEIKDGRRERLCEDRALALSDLSVELMKYGDRKVILVGDGASISYEYLKNKHKNISPAPANLRVQRASSTAMAAFEIYRQSGAITCEELMPVYLRLPQAQRELILNQKLGVNK